MEAERGKDKKLEIERDLKKKSGRRKRDWEREWDRGKEGRRE